MVLEGKTQPGWSVRSRQGGGCVEDPIPMTSLRPCLRRGDAGLGGQQGPGGREAVGCR